MSFEDDSIDFKEFVKESKEIEELTTQESDNDSGFEVKENLENSINEQNELLDDIKSEILQQCEDKPCQTTKDQLIRPEILSKRILHRSFSQPQSYLKKNHESSRSDQALLDPQISNKILTASLIAKSPKKSIIMRDKKKDRQTIGGSIETPEPLRRYTDSTQLVQNPNTSLSILNLSLSQTNPLNFSNTITSSARYTKSKSPRNGSIIPRSTSPSKNSSPQGAMTGPIEFNNKPSGSKISNQNSTSISNTPSGSSGTDSNGNLDVFAEQMRNLPDLLYGEKPFQQINRVSLLVRSEEDVTFSDGSLLITNFRLIFVPPDGKEDEAFRVALMDISSLSSKGSQIKIYTHSLKAWKLNFSGNTSVDAYECIEKRIYKSSFIDIFAFHYRISNSYHLSERKYLFKIKDEYERMGVYDSKSNWKITYLNNNDYELCSTYPKLLVIPASLEEEDIRGCSRFRSKERLPALTYKSRNSQGSISRSSQPLVGISGAKSDHDQKFLEAIQKTTQSTQLFIIDARPRENATAQRAMGAGYEDSKAYNANLQFMGIDNIHVVRDSWNKLFDLLKKKNVEGSWLRELEDTGWLRHVKSILSGALQILNLFSSGHAILVHCSDGWDRTAQLCSLAQIMIDPFYRTLVGFITLIEKDWLHFGFKFAERCGHHDGNKQHSPAERSPIFVLFLDCVHQLIKQYPCSFQFSELLLITLADHAYSCQFGTFLCNSQREREQYRLSSTTECLWNYILKNTEHYLSPSYEPQSDSKRYRYTLSPCDSIKKIVFWESYFFRWSKSLLPSETVELKVELLSKKLENLQQEHEKLKFQLFMAEQSNARYQQSLQNHLNFAPPRSISITTTPSTLSSSSSSSSTTSSLMVKAKIPNKFKQAGQFTIAQNRLLRRQVEEEARQIIHDVLLRVFDIVQTNSSDSPFTEVQSLQTTNSSEENPSPSYPPAPPPEKLTEWIPDHWIDSCCNCKEPFNLFTRRHHCRACGYIFCGTCSSKKICLPDKPSKDIVRVCDQCYNQAYQKWKIIKKHDTIDNSNNNFRPSSELVPSNSRDISALKRMSNIFLMIQNPNSNN